MPRIHTVAADGTITAGDKLIGSDGAENANFVTRNYTVGGIKDFILNGTHAGSFTTVTASGNATIGGAATITGALTTSDNATIGGNLTITGNTTIAGNLQVDGSTITFDDPILVLSGDTAPTSNNQKDTGIAFRWYESAGSGSAKIGFFGFDESTMKFTFVPDASISSEVVSGAAGTIVVKDVEAEEIYGHKFIDSQDGQYYVDPNNGNTSIKVAGKIEASTFAGGAITGDSIVIGSGTGPASVTGNNTIILNSSTLNSSLSILSTHDPANPTANYTSSLKIGRGHSNGNEAFNLEVQSGYVADTNFVYDFWTIRDSNNDLIMLYSPLNSGQLQFSKKIIGQVIEGGAFIGNQFFDSQDTNYYLDPANTGVSLKVAGKIEANNTDTINGININNTNQEMSGIGEIYAHKFIDSQTGSHYLDPGNSNLSLVTAGKATIGAFTIPKTIGSAGQVLKVPSSGTELVWSNDLQSAASASVGSGTNTVPTAADDFVVNINSTNGGMTIVTQDGTNAGNGPEFRLATNTQQNAYILDYDEATEKVRMQRHGTYFLQAGASEVQIPSKLRVGNGDETAESSSDAFVVNEGASNTGMSILNAGNSSTGFSRLTFGRDGDTDAYHLNYDNSSDQFEIRKDGNLIVSIAPNGPSNAVMVNIGNLLKLGNVSTFADDSAAGSGGLTTGMVYKKSDGTLMIKS